MKSLKNHLSLILPLFAIFFAVEFFFLLDRVIKSYENNLKEDYTIIVVSNKKIAKEDIQNILDLAKFEEIKPDELIKKIKDENIGVDIDTLKSFLPKFYQIYLNHFPSTYELKSIKESLKRIDGVKRVETFAKSHTKIFNLLMVSKQISKIFMAVIGVISLLLIVKQVQVWYLEHKERMYIMELFGAPLWMRSGVLIRLAIVDTIVATLMLLGFFYYILNSQILKSIIGFLNITIDTQKVLQDCFLLGGIGLVVTIFSVIFVTTRQIKE